MRKQADGAMALHWAAHWDDLETAELLLHLSATPLTAPDYFIPVEQDSDVYRMNSKSRAIPGAE